MAMAVLQSCGWSVGNSNSSSSSRRWIAAQNQELGSSKTFPIVSERLPFKREGYNYWRWRDHKVHYVVQGKGLPLVLVHGFGASLYHWRYNIPELSKYYEVYAMDLLGFGWSEKALIDYDLLLWSNQVAAFVEQVVKKPAILVGNSIGGLTVLQAAAQHPEIVAGLALVNPAGRFKGEKQKTMESPTTEKLKETNFEWLAFNRIRDWIRREIILFSFRQLSQRLRITSALNSVYKDRTNVDDYLIESILQPAEDPNAAEVFYRMISRFLFQPSDISLDNLLASLHCPLLVLWGDWDPLARATKADKIKALHDAAAVVRLPAGHCAHDEVPEQVNRELILWIASNKSLTTLDG